MEPAETPQELFAKCEENARVADRETYELELDLVAGELTFPHRLFKSVPTLDSAPSTGDSDDIEFAQTLQKAVQYQSLVQLLKEYKTREQRWLLLALWLKEEGICEPWEFLHPEIYKNLTQEKRAKLGISITDIKHYCQVEAYKPYFERLLADHRAGNHLSEVGYNEEAIKSAEKKRTAASAACEWLACINNSHPDAHAFRCAHSRVSVAIKKFQKNAGPSF